MPSPRKSTARMSTGGKPPGKSHMKDTISDEDNDDDHSARPRRLARPSAKKLAAEEDQEYSSSKLPVSEDDDNDSDIEIVENAMPSTPVKKAKSSYNKKALDREEESPSPTKKTVSKSRKKILSPETVDTDDDPDGITAPLDRDDKMYPEAPQSKVRAYKPGTPFPTQSTRRGHDPGSPSPEASPKKKKKKESLEDTSTKSKGKSRQVRGDVESEDWNEDLISGVPEADLGSPEQGNLVKHSAKISLDALDGLSFSDVFSASKEEPKSKDGDTVYLEDLVPKAKAKAMIVLPDICEVTEPGLQDPFLLKSGFYQDLVNLPGGRQKNSQFYMLPMFPSNKLQGGRPNFEGWKVMCPDMDIGKAIKPLIFQQSGRFINPSRIDPRKLGVEEVFPNERYEITVDGSTAICLSCVMVIDSFLHNIDTMGQSNLSNKYHFLRAKYMAYEFERASSLFTLLFGKGQLYALIKGDANEFQTKSSMDSSNTKSIGSQPQVEEESEEYTVPGFMNTQSTSPSKPSRPLPKPEPSKNKLIKVRGLAFNDTVPIYDGRTQSFDYNDLAKHDGKLDQVFKRFPAGEEVPPCSYAVVAYVSQSSSYKDRVKNEEGKYIPGDELRWKFTPFIQWVIVVGISKKNIRGYTK